jgi:hypothetical protein
MSEQIIARKASGPGLGKAIAGAVFADFIGVLLFAVPVVGWELGLITMVAGSPAIAWVALEGHPRRQSLTWRVGIANAVLLTVAAVGLVVAFIAMLSSVQFG